MEPLTVAEIKEHLRLDLSDTTEDAYLETLVITARRRVETATGRTIIGLHEIKGDDLFVAKHAMKLIVGHLYVNREATAQGKPVTDLPLGVKWLLDPLKIWASE